MIYCSIISYCYYCCTQLARNRQTLNQRNGSNNLTHLPSRNVCEKKIEEDFTESAQTYICAFWLFFRGPEPWSNLILTKFNKCRNFHMAWRNVKCMTLRLLSTFIRFTANSLRRLISNLLNLKLNFVSDAAWIEKRIRFELKHSRSWYLIWLLLFSRF